MRDLLRSPLINIAGAIAGGILFGFGAGRFANEPTVASGVLAMAGLVLLWWSLVERRKGKRGAPESELDGSHTVE